MGLGLHDTTGFGVGLKSIVFVRDCFNCKPQLRPSVGVPDGLWNELVCVVTYCIIIYK